jgi:hypothetical protein
MTWAGLMFVLLPAALVLVGLDLMEWSMLFGGFTGDAIDPQIWPAGLVLACIALLANLILGAHSLHWSHAAVIGMRAFLLAGTMGLLLLISASSADATHTHHLRHLKLFGIAAVAVVGSFFLWGRQTDAPPPVFNYHGERSFSIKYPEGWRAKLWYPEKDGQNVLDPIYHARGFVSFTANGEIILMALSWEITTSGELTNYATRSFPRNSRVLLFLGYVMLVAFGVFTIFPTTYRLTQRMLGFDSEQWVLRGILILGVPFLMVAFSSRITHLLWHKEPEASTE